MSELDEMRARIETLEADLRSAIATLLYSSVRNCQRGEMAALAEKYGVELDITKVGPRDLGTAFSKWTA